MGDRHTHGHGRLLNRRLAWIAASVVGGALLFLIIEAAIFTWFGLSHRVPLPLEQRVGALSVGLSSRLHAGTRRNPIAETASTLTVGQTGYRTCVQCHGAQGDGVADLGQSVFPPAASLLSDDAKGISDAQLFWIVKNGLSFTAMPAYKTQYRDEAIWAIVGYIRTLQQGRAITFGPPLVSTSPGSPQGPPRLALQLTDTSLQPQEIAASSGPIELDIANQGARGHQVVISAPGKISFNAERMFPGQSVRLQGRLDPGEYVIAVDPSEGSPGPVTRLTVR
jgi:mono/diheme cytochrome c family protein